MEWNMNTYNEFVSKVLNHKEDYKGEKIDEYVFAGAGQECIKLENEKRYVFVSYEDVLNEEEGTAKAVFDFFFNEEKESEENSSDSKIVAIEKVATGSVMSDDIYTSDDVISVVFNCEGDELKVRVDVDGMDFNEIDFDDPESISEQMKSVAINKFAIRAVEHLIDCEVLTGEIGVDFMVEDECGDASSIMHADFCQMHDIFMMMRLAERTELAKVILGENDFTEYLSFSTENKSTETAEIDDEDIIEEFCGYEFTEIAELIEELKKVGIVKIPADDGYDVIMKGRNGIIFINDDEYKMEDDEAVIYTVSDFKRKIGLTELRAQLIELQEENQRFYESCELEEVI